MPHDPHDNRYPHLPLVAEDPNPQRRRRSAPPSPPPDRGGRASFAEQLRQSIDDLEQEVTRRPRPPVGIQPHLVFRVPLARSASSQIVAELLERLGIRIVGIESDRAIIAFRDEANLSEFRQAVAAYERGPQEGINPRTGKPYEKTQWDVLEYVEAANMRLWNQEDRIGRRLAHGIGEHGQAIQLDKLYRVDVELWHRGTDELARAAVRELSLLVDSDASSEERVCDTFIGDLLCLARVAVRGPKLDALLNLDIVAEVELPPQPVFDARAARFVTARDFPAPPLPAPDGPAVCVVDSGVATNHPLLANNMGHAEAVVPDSDSPADEYGHGTMVGALAVFGDVRRCYESGGFASPVTLYSARVLNNENRFDDERLIIHQMRRAVVDPQIEHTTNYNESRTWTAGQGDFVVDPSAYHSETKLDGYKDASDAHLVRQTVAITVQHREQHIRELYRNMLADVSAARAARRQSTPAETPPPTSSTTA